MTTTTTTTTDLITAGAAARLLQKHHSVVRRMCRDGELTATYVPVPGRDHRVLCVARADVQAILQRREEEELALQLGGTPTEDGVLIPWEQVPEAIAEYQRDFALLEALVDRGVLTRDHELVTPHGAEPLLDVGRIGLMQ